MSAAAAPATRRDRLKQLRAFCETTRLGSLSAAARAIGTAQPAVSNHVRTLEEELGAALFRREGDGITPTRAAQDLYRIAYPLVEELLRLPGLFDEHLQRAEPASLRIGAGEVSAAWVLPDMIGRYVARWPRTRVEVSTGTGGQRLEWLRRFELDLVVGAFEDPPDDIVFRPLVPAGIMLITPEEHPLGCCESVGFEALTSHAMVALLSGHHMRQVQDVVLRLHGARPRVVLEVDGWDTMVHHVAAGVGVALVPDVCVVEHERVRTVRVRLPNPSPVRTYGLALRRDGFVGLAARRFVDLVSAAPGDAEETA